MISLEPLFFLNRSTMHENVITELIPIRSHLKKKKRIQYPFLILAVISLSILLLSLLPTYFSEWYYFYIVLYYFRHSSIFFNFSFEFFNAIIHWKLISLIIYLRCEIINMCLNWIIYKAFKMKRNVNKHWKSNIFSNTHTYYTLPIMSRINLVEILVSNLGIWLTDKFKDLKRAAEINIDQSPEYYLRTTPNRMGKYFLYSIFRSKNSCKNSNTFSNFCNNNKKYRQNKS